MIGRLTDVKNNHLLLEAAAKLKRWIDIEGFHFLIIGDGELRLDLEKKALSLGIGDHITLTNFSKERLINDIRSLYRELQA